MNKSIDGQKTTKQLILDYIQHNKRHYITLKIKGKEIYPCARCFGLWIGTILGFFLTSPFWLGLIYIDNFILVFTAAWLLVIPNIIDWSSVKLGLRKGNNKIRVTVGFFYGIGVAVYIFVLPINILFRIGTYLLYELVFFLIRKKFNILHIKK